METDPRTVAGLVQRRLFARQSRVIKILFWSTCRTRTSRNDKGVLTEPGSNVQAKHTQDASKLSPVERIT